MIVTMTSRVSFNTDTTIHAQYEVDPGMIVINASPDKKIRGTKIKLGDLKIIEGVYPMFSLITDDPIKANNVYIIKEWWGNIEGDYRRLDV